MSARAAGAFAVVGVALCAAAAAYLMRSGPDETRRASDERAARAAVGRFLDRYVTEQGRVVRYDQGGDTVSEGQAYALLGAVAIGDEARFRRVWRWTGTNLGREDRLLSWLWRDGRVADPQPASDADLDAARALLLAGGRFQDGRLRSDGLAMARGVVQHESLRLGRRLVLLPGPWARGRRVVNPSYLAPAAFDQLGEATSDPVWRALANEGRSTASDLTSSSPGLPPDWAVIRTGGRVAPTSGPSQTTSGPEFSYDAQRLPIRFAESCNPRDRTIAARLWPLLRELWQRGELTARLSLDGRPLEPGSHALAYVSAAAAADAAEDLGARDQLLAQAERADREHLTYYGAAWVALGRVMLTTDLLGRCEGERTTAGA